MGCGLHDSFKTIIPPSTVYYPQIDQGANISAAPHQWMLHDYVAIPQQLMKVANDKYMHAVGIGFMKVPDNQGVERHEVTFHCPDVSWPIYSPNATSKYEHQLGNLEVTFSIGSYHQSVKPQISPKPGYCTIHDWSKVRNHPGSCMSMTLLPGTTFNGCTSLWYSPMRTSCITTSICVQALEPAQPQSQLYSGYYSGCCTAC